MEENKALVGHVHSLETFGLVDGRAFAPLYFYRGCRMRCRYCHNPETWSMSGGEEWSAKDLFNRVYRYRTYWKKRRYYRQRRRATSADRFPAGVLCAGKGKGHPHHTGYGRKSIYQGRTVFR